jgi:hypothetical protein
MEVDCLKKKFGDRIGDGSFENAKNESEPSMGFSSLRAVRRIGAATKLVPNPEIDPLENVLNAQF